MIKAGPLICTPLILLFFVSLAIAAPRKGGSAPGFSASTVAGQQVSLSSLAGSVVILDFFATWCAPCRSSTGHLVGLQRKYDGKGLSIVGMSIGTPSETVLRQYISEKGIPYPVVDATERIERDYGVRSLPLLCVIDRDGRIAGVFNGFSREIAAAIDTLVASLLAKR